MLTYFANDICANGGGTGYFMMKKVRNAKYSAYTIRSYPPVEDVKIRENVFFEK